MIRLTKAGEYGLRAIRYLVESGDEARISIGDISINKKIPEPFLRITFFYLKNRAQLWKSNQHNYKVYNI